MRTNNTFLRLWVCALVVSVAAGLAPAAADTYTGGGDGTSWTDADNWAAVCDPRLYPTIGLGYRYGRTPELFSVASPTAGLMFSNDVMPVKIRFFYATGPTDWRGLYKENVS